MVDRPEENTARFTFSLSDRPSEN